MDAAVDLVRRAVRDRLRMRIITDYDVDGTTSSLILQATMRILEAGDAVDWHIPNRFGEGYGFTQIAARKAAEDKVGVVVTADIGVRDHASVAIARDAGIEVLICDHHLPAGESVPADATVLCPPQDGCTYPNRSLAACGVSLKLATALLRDHPRWPLYLASMLKLAAIGTVCDMVSLSTQENRAIVALGLRELAVGRHSPGLAALLAVAGIRERVRVSDIGFRIGPRINAPGRVADAGLVVQLLGERDPEKAKILAAKLDSLNSERQDIQARLHEEALARVGDPPPPFVLVSGEEDLGWHRGVVGIVAGKLKESVNRPVAVAAVRGELAIGSVRSIPRVHAVRALETAADLLVKFGGHPMAAGFTIRTADLPELQRRLCAFVEARVEADEWVPERAIDADISPADVGPKLLDELRRIGPYGSGNPNPNLFISSVRPFGVQVRQTRHDKPFLKFFLPTGKGAVQAVWWSGAAHQTAIAGGPVDLLVGLDESTWQGETRVQLDVVDARVAR
jgi:single-stranded-DNA-specific exonuclease